MRLPTKILRGLGLVALLLLLAAGALALRLAEGPIPLGPVAGLVTRAIERAGPFKISFKEPALAWSREQETLLFEVRDLYVTTQTGRFVAAAPAVGLRVDTTALVRDRQVRMREAEIRLPALQLDRGRDGELVLSFGDRLGALPLRDATGGGLLANLAGGAQEAGDPRLGSLRRIRIEAQGLRYVDGPSGRVVDTGRARLRLTRAAEAGWEVRLDAATIGGAEGSRVRLAVAPAAGAAGLQDVGVELVRVPVRALDGLLPAVNLGEVELPVSGELRVTVDPATRTPGPGRFSLTAEAGRVALPGLLPGPVEVRGATLSGEAGQGWREVSLRQGEVRVGEATLRVLGASSRTPEQDVLKLSLDADRLDVPTLMRLWPLPLAPGARRWVAESVSAGRALRANFELRRPADAGWEPRRLGYTLDFAFAQAVARFLPGWPAAEIAAGTGRLEPDRFVLDVGPGRVGGAEARKAVVTLTRLRSPEPLLLDVALEGGDAPVPAVLDLLARKPLELTQQLGFDPAGTRGRFRGTVNLTLPLADKVRPEDVRKRARGTLAELGARQVRPGYDLTGGDLRLDLDDERLELVGEVALNRVPARVTWRERLKPGAERRRIDVAATLDPERAKALNAGWLEGVEGALPVEAVVTEVDRRPRRIDVKADLAPVGLAFPQFLLAKARGEAGRLEARLEQPDEKRITIADGTATWAGVSLRGGGDLRLGPFEWRRFDLRDVRTPEAELKGEVMQDRGTIRARLEAERLDVRPLLARDEGKAEGEEATSALELDLQAKRLLLGPEPLEAVTLRAARRADGSIATASFAARLPGGGDAGLELKAATLPGEFRGETSDLGGLFRGLGIERSRIDGGRGRVEGRVEARAGGPPAYVGEAKLREFVLRDAPLVARILSLASLQGLGNTFAGRGLGIERVTLPFTWAGGTVEVKQARAVGSALGVRVDGTVDVDGRRLDLEGTAAPLYALNRFIGQIPILGDLMRGEKADAAIAATFSVKGTFDEPQVAVNPLAALVPGLLRDLFGDLGAGGGAEQRELRD